MAEYAVADAWAKSSWSGDTIDKAHDDDTGTAWSVAEGPGWWMKFHIATAETVDRVRFYGASTISGELYSLWASEDGNRFLKVADIDENNFTSGAWNEYDFAAMTAQYFFLIAEDEVGNDWLRIGEIEVHDAGHGAPGSDMDVWYMPYDNTVQITSNSVYSSAVATNIQNMKHSDGSRNDHRWLSNGAWTGKWVKIDLGSSQEVTGHIIRDYMASGEEYDIDYSDDDSNWTTISAEVADLNGGANRTVSHDAVTARYWRIIGTSQPGGNWGGVMLWIPTGDTEAASGGGGASAGDGSESDALLSYLQAQGATSGEVVGALNELNGTDGVGFREAYNTYFGL